MTTPLRKRKRVLRETALEIVHYYVLCCEYDYPPEIAKQYAIHRRERESQGGRGLRLGMRSRYDEFTLPRPIYSSYKFGPGVGKTRPEIIHRKVMWEQPWKEHRSSNCDPALFDRLVEPWLAWILTSPGVCELKAANVVILPKHLDQEATFWQTKTQLLRIPKWPVGSELFLLAIQEYPTDSGPRKVFADWLGEQGDPREGWMRGL